MLWLDSTYPTGSSAPGTARGPCDATSGDPKAVESQHPDAFVRYMNIKWGELGSTDVGPVPAPSPAPSPAPGPGPSPGPPSPPHACGASSTCVCHPGMNHDGHNMAATAAVAADEAACCDLCTRTTGCVGWTYVPQSGNECWLKDRIEAFHADPYVTSGVVNGTAPAPPSPSPSSCPGGLLSKCIDLCPSTPATAYKACVESCVTRCSHEIAAFEAGEVEAYRK